MKYKASGPAPIFLTVFVLVNERHFWSRDLLLFVAIFGALSFYVLMVRGIWQLVFCYCLIFSNGASAAGAAKVPTTGSQSIPASATARVPVTKKLLVAKPEPEDPVFECETNFQYFNALDESDVGGLRVNGEPIFHVWKSYILGATLEYRNIFQRQPDNKDVGVQDAFFFVGDEALLASRDKSLRFQYRLELLLPTSDVSKQASMLPGNMIELTLRKETPIFDFRSINQVFLFRYTYDTSNVEGTESNDSFALWNKLNLRWSITKLWMWENEVSLFTHQTYAGATEALAQYISVLYYNVSEGTSLDLSTEFKSTSLFDSSLFDRSNYIIYLGVQIRI